MTVLREISFPDPADNILFDQVLLEVAEAGESGETLRFWESPVPFIVLGRIGRPADELNVAAVMQQGISVLRRCSGGGTVVQGPGCLNFALVLSKDEQPEIADLKRSYGYILSRVTAALSECGVEADYWPISDIALNGSRRKISGNAQKRGRRFILHHGTLLYNADLNLIERYLATPPSMPDYRQARPHLEFVANAGIEPRRFIDGLTRQFGAGPVQSEVSATEQARLLELRSAVQVHVGL